MSCTIYLMRHGIAAPASPGSGDFERPLTEDGVRKTLRAAKGLSRLGIAPAAVLSSPLRRAEETAQLVASVLAPALVTEIYPPLAPGHDPRDLLDGLRPRRKLHEILLVGHQPDLGELASYILTGSTNLVPLPFKKAGTAALLVAGLPPRGAGSLQWFLTPGQLRALAKSGG
jgi:phosphohistidine phosphatase